MQIVGAWYNTAVTTQDILNILLIIGFLVITVCIALITYFFIKALKSIASLADSLENTAQDVREKIQMKTLRIVPALLVALVGRILKRGR